ncbi:MAG TPA: protein kinase [Terriglobales bacterium]
MNGNDARKISDALTIGATDGRTSSSAGGGDRGERNAAILQVGQVLGGRFQILEMLGLGGMGAVYKAHDRDINRVIALKCIRPELSDNQEIVQRFMQELLLARQVSHKNVIRIYDVRDSGGLKFITMEYVAGRDLGSLMEERGKLPAPEAVAIMRQVCSGLAAAHAEGVVHRDLKPSNIMVEANGRVVVMDFGLARAQDTDLMTQTGAILGTFQYMSPEQAKGEKVDARSDVFTVGIILYELLTGSTPYKCDTSLASLLKRTQEDAVPPSALNGTIPRTLNTIVCRCLERDLKRRYQNATEMLRDLDAWQGNRAGVGLTFHPNVGPWGRDIPWPLIATVATVIVLAVAGWLLRDRLLPHTVSQPSKPITVLVADFTNHTGDPIFDSALEPMFNVALEGASFISAYNRGTARKLAQKLPNPTDKLDEQPARLVALSQGVSAVITGEISLRGNAYTVSAMALDAATGNVLAKSEASASNKNDVVSTIPELVAPIRKALGDTTPDSTQLEALRGSLTAASLEAVHQYGIGMEQQSAGRRDEALVSFAKAAQLDPGFARAYSGMAASALPLGKIQDAEKYIKLAMQHEDRMTERERLRVRGLYYFVAGDFPKCIDEYGELVSKYSADNIGYGNLGACYARLRNFPKAVEAQEHAVEIVPKYAVQRLYLAFYTSYSGDFQGGEREARAALALNPSSEAYLALAEAQVGEGQFSPARETYGTLEKMSALGASMATSGLADIDLFEGRFTEAIRKLEQGIAADVAAKDTENAGDKLTRLADIQLLRGDKQAAAASATKALADNQSEKIKFLAALIFKEAGQNAKAQDLAKGLASELEAEPRAYAKIISADLAEQHGDSREAIKEFTDANTLLDTWIGHLELGRAYLRAGQFVEADSEFDRCIKRRGETLELFMDNIPTAGYFPVIYYLQGRVREGMKSPGFAESYRAYLSIRGQAGEDPLLAEIHRRLGQ